MHEHDLIVIGAGPGGYIAAIRAAQLGLNVACVEQEPALGGTCLRIGCIPSKALLESSARYAEARHGLASHGVRVDGVQLDLPAMMRRKNEIVDDLTRGVAFLFKKHKITRYVGHARLEGAGTVGISASAPSEAHAGARANQRARQAAPGSARRTEGDAAGRDQAPALAVATPDDAPQHTPNGDPQRVKARHIIIATGSREARLPGVELDGDRIGTSTEALSYGSVPHHLVVIGAGYIGLEMGSVWSRLGAKVTVLEYLDRILPGMDGELAADALKLFRKQGLAFHLGTRVSAARVHAKGCVVQREGADALECDRVLLAVGRVPNTDDLGLGSAGVQTDGRGRITVNEHFQTSAAGVYAIGDVIRGPMLAHKAEEEGVACVEHIVTGYGHVNYDAIPGVVYTEPEIAAVGRTEEELKSAGTPYRRGVFHFRANARAKALGHIEGKVKLLAHAETDRILGVHIIGPRAGDLIAEAAVAIEFGASAEDVARSSHAHPTLAECLKEAALAVHGRTLNA
jgi:dihydrolipoamide dehydrogenase